MVDQLTTADIVGLRQLVDAYADAVDRLDETGLAQLFTDKGTLRVQTDDGPIENEWIGSELTRSFEQLRSYHRTLHQVGGAVFEATDNGATGRVACLAHHYQKTSSGPVDLVMMVRYHDRYSKDQGAWRIDQRRVAVQWTELHPAHPIRRPAR